VSVEVDRSHDPAACVRCQAIAHLIVVKTCGCGARYTAAEWGELQYVGVHDDWVERIELRNCRCGSTICVDLNASANGKAL
jgi:hypothetical protein